MQQPECFLMSRKKAQVTPLFIRLHWLPVAARIKFKVLMCAYKTTTGAASIYLNSLVQTYASSRSLRSESERRLAMPSQRGTNHSHGPFHGLCPAGGMSNSNSFRHFQKTTKDISFLPAPDQLILTLTYSILFYSILFYPIKKIN